MPDPAVGVQSIFGISAFEASYRAATTVDRFYEFVSESITRRNRVMQSQALSGTYLPRGSRRVLTGHDAAGDVNMEVSSKGFGRLFQAILGSSAVPVQQGGTTAYLQTHPMGSLSGKSFNLQKQLRDEDGTAVKTFTYRGTKVTAAEFAIAVDGILNLALSVDAGEERDDVAAAASSYTQSNLFHFQQASLTVNGATAALVSDATVRIENSVNVDRRHLGNSGLKSEPQRNGFNAVTGTFTAEVQDGTYYDLFEADAGGQLVLTFTGAVISGAYNESLVITVPKIHVTGNTPQVGGPEIITVDVPWEASYDGTNSPITLAYTSTDTTV